jgi:hypothetical protein
MGKKPTKKKTPKDPNQLAAFIVESATNQDEPKPTTSARQHKKKPLLVDQKD